MVGVQGHSTGIQNANDAGEDTAGLSEIKTSRSEDQEERSEAMAENGESGISYSV